MAEPFNFDEEPERFQWVDEGNNVHWLTAEELEAVENG